MKATFIKITTGLLLLTMVSMLFSGDKVSFRTNWFSDNTGTSVQSPVLEFAKALTNKLDFLIRYNLDRVSIAPVRGLAATPSPVDGITGASRPVDEGQPASESYTKDRNEFNIGLATPGIQGSYYYSTESDYVGRMLTLAANHDYNQKNTNISATYSFGWDNVNPLGTDTTHTKRAHSFNLTLTQVLSPKLIGRIGADFSYIDGFQSNPYRTVNTGGQILLENHPLGRTRGAFFLKLNRYFKTQTALNFEYRFYRDDWDIQSHTANVYYHQRFSPNVLIRYRYRYYRQTEAFFYQDTYPVVQEYRTSDYKLQAFDAHLFGFKVEYNLRDLFKEGAFSFMSSSTFEAKYERYFSSNDFTADIFQIGLVFNY